MGENDWFSVVKVSTVWDSNVSDERLIYFIWNSLQTNTGKLDSFYRNNYYTVHEVYNRLITDYPDELKRQGKDNTEWKKIRKDLIDYKAGVKLFLMQMKKIYPWPIDVDLNNITKEQLLGIHKNIMEIGYNIRTLHDANKNRMKTDLNQAVTILSKRNSKLNYFLEREQKYLMDFKRWLSKENL